MSYHYHFHSIGLSGNGLPDMHIPFGIPTHRHLSTAPALHEHWQRAIQKKLLDKGNFQTAFNWFTGDIEPTIETIEIILPKTNDSVARQALHDLPKNLSITCVHYALFDHHKNRSDSVKKSAPDSTHCYWVPALSLEYIGHDPASAKLGIQDAILLEFTRNQRRNNAMQLLPVIWQNAGELQRRQGEFRFPTLSERNSRQNQQRWLPLMAQDISKERMRGKAEVYCYGREQAVAELQTLWQTTQPPSVLVVGASGVGKTALIEQALATLDADYAFKTWRSTPARMVESLTAEFGWEDPFAQALHELGHNEPHPRQLLYINQWAQLFEVGQYAGNPVSMAEYMRDYVARGHVTVVSECTPEELALLDMRAPGYSQLLHVVRLDNPPVNEQANIVARRLQSSYPQLSISKQAINEIIRLQHRYNLYSGFPGKTVRFLENLAHDALPHQRQTKKASNISRSDIIQRFCDESGMPQFMIDARSTDMNPERATAHLQQQLIGQETAVQQVVEALTLAKTRLNRPGKPIASFLFVGPTGVGKTELAKALAGYLFGDPNRMLRFDMSEYADALAIGRLTGDSPQGGAGLLTRAVRQQPFSVLLFDEVEKADASFFDLLLQMLGEARLTDANGQVADFSACVVVMTSNLGAQAASKTTPGFVAATQNLSDHYLQIIRQNLRPELINRIDRIVPFAALDTPQLTQIIERELVKLQRRGGLQERDCELAIDPHVAGHLARQITQFSYGARAVQRLLEKQVVSPLARQLNQHPVEVPLSISISLQADTITIDCQRLQRPARARQQLDDNVTLAHFSGLALNGLRETLRLMQGPVFHKLLSRWDQLERKQKKQGERFWRKPALAEEYGRYHDLIEQARTLCEDYRQQNDACQLAWVGLTGLPDLSQQDLLAIQKRWLDYRLQLIQTTHPKNNNCVCALYGPIEQVNWFTEQFEQLCDANVFKFTKRYVWYSTEAPTEDEQENIPSEDASQKTSKQSDEEDQEKTEDRDYYLYTDDKKAPLSRRKAKNVGVELQINGPAAWLYFQDEAGRHERKKSHQEQHAHKIAACVHAGKFSDYTTPNQVYRRTFVDPLPLRRIYLPNGYLDLHDHIEYEGADWLLNGMHHDIKALWQDNLQALIEGN